MDPNRMAGMMALGDAFGALRSIGKGPFQANATMRGMQLVQAAKEKREREAQQKAALTNMGVIPQGGFGALSGPLSAPQALAQAGMYGEAIQAQMQPGADPYKGIYKVGNDIVQVDPRAGNSRVIHEGPEAAAKRETARGADGRLYYLDTGELALPGAGAGPEAPNWKTLSVNGALVRVDPNTGQTETLIEAPAPGVDYGVADKLGDNFRSEPAVKIFSDVQDAAARVAEFYANPGSVSDYGLAVSFAKLVDPGSVAREGEVAAVQKSGALTQSMKQALLNAITGEGALPEQMRREIASLAQGFYDRQAGKYEGFYNDYAARADRLRVPRDLALPSPLSPFSIIQEQTATPAQGVWDGQAALPQGTVVQNPETGERAISNGDGTFRPFGG